ncbi:MAG: HD domain-containing protein [Chthoniobacteraceae bacterium]
MINDPIQHLMKAASYAARKHSDQKRADGMTPYFAHVARVTLIARHLFEVTDLDVLTASLLHDVIEDTNTDHDEIAEIFGPRVAKYVILLTKNKMLSKKLREQDYERKLSKAPEQVQIAKLADAFDNLSDRVGSTKLPKTLETAKKWLIIFKTTLKTPAGKRAHRMVSQLVADIEKGNGKPSPHHLPRRTS